MASFKHRNFSIFILAALCNATKWIGPAQTAFEHPESTTAAPTSVVLKPTLLRRTTSALSICGFESGQAREFCALLKVRSAAKFRLESPLSCNAGYSCDFSTIGADANAALVYGCCSVSSSCSTLYTGCSNYQMSSSNFPNVLTWWDSSTLVVDYQTELTSLAKIALQTCHTANISRFQRWMQWPTGAVRYQTLHGGRSH